jgi:hypothetical protein
MATFGFDFLERYHKDGDELLSHIVHVTVMKARFHFLMLNPKSSQGSRCINIHQTRRKSANKRLPES